METREKITCAAYDNANWNLIPEHMRAGMKDYIESGCQPGSFLTAVLEGRLREACARADHINAVRIDDYAAFLRQHVPNGSHGSPENYRAWIARGGLNGTQPADDNGKPKIYAFANGRGVMGWSGAAIAEDGTPLKAGHCSSSEEWLRHDMGADGRSDWKHKIYREHYPDGFQVEWVSYADTKTHPVLGPIIERLNAEHTEKPDSNLIATSP